MAELFDSPYFLRRQTFKNEPGPFLSQLFIAIQRGEVM